MNNERAIVIGGLLVAAVCVGVFLWQASRPVTSVETQLDEEASRGVGEVTTDRSAASSGVTLTPVKRTALGVVERAPPDGGVRGPGR